MEWWGITLICLAIFTSIILLSVLFYKIFFKRFYDIILSGISILVLSPVFIVMIIIVSIAMKGNPFFTQKRPGKNKKIFKMIKFRTMTNTRDEKGNLLPDSERLTKFGKFLRKTSLDELPELFNIFIGNMSIVGPRPQLIRDMVFMTDEQNARHSVRQGLTGLAQVSGRNAISWERKIECDLEYISNISFFNDISIILKTILKVFKSEGVSQDGMDTAEDYGDYLLRNGKITEEEYNNKMEEVRDLYE